MCLYEEKWGKDRFHPELITSWLNAPLTRSANIVSDRRNFTRPCQFLFDDLLWQDNRSNFYCGPRTNIHTWLFSEEARTKHEDASSSCLYAKDIIFAKVLKRKTADLSVSQCLGPCSNCSIPLGTRIVLWRYLALCIMTYILLVTISNSISMKVSIGPGTISLATRKHPILFIEHAPARLTCKQKTKVSPQIFIVKKLLLQSENDSWTLLCQNDNFMGF